MKREVKPRPLPDALRRDIEAAVENATGGYLSSRDARAILAALEHERALLDGLRDAAENYALHDCTKNGKCEECPAFEAALRKARTGRTT